MRGIGGRNIFRVGNFSLEKIRGSNKNGQKLKGSESFVMVRFKRNETSAEL